MTDSQYLLLVLAVVYVVECAAWVHAASVAFNAPRSGRWAFPSAFMGNPDGGFVWKPLLPGWRTFLVARPLPLSLSPSRVLTYTADAIGADRRCNQAEAHRAWASPVERREKTVLVAGEPLVRLESAAHAQTIADSLRRIAAAAPDDREGAIETALTHAFNTAGIRAKLESFDQRSRGLQTLCGLLFMVVFLVGPVLIWRHGTPLSWLGVVLAMLLLAAAIAHRFSSLHRDFHPELRDERWMHVLVFLLNPLGAMRATDVLSRDLLWGFHPLAVAQVVCSADAFAALARATLLDLTFPLQPACPLADPAAREVESWSRQRKLAAARRFLESAGLSGDELLRPDAPSGAEAAAYCPRCQRQYHHAEGTCQTCGNIALCPFAASEA